MNGLLVHIPTTTAGRVGESSIGLKILYNAERRSSTSFGFIFHTSFFFNIYLNSLSKLYGTVQVRDGDTGNIKKKKLRKRQHYVDVEVSQYFSSGLCSSSSSTISCQKLPRGRCDPPLRSLYAAIFTGTFRKDG